MMEKWASLTVLAYVMLVAVLLIPAIVAFASFIADDNVSWPSDFSFLRTWQLWLYFAVVLLIQALLLLYPVRISQKKLVPKKITWLQILITALMMSILLIAGNWSVTMAIAGDNMLQESYLLVSILYLLGWWVVWSGVFYCYSRIDSPELFSRRTTAWLIKGSILELLVAIPSHIIVRRRGDCCAPGVTALGIAAGLIIMVFAFGPGLYFLFRKRFDRMKPRSKRTSIEVA